MQQCSRVSAAGFSERPYLSLEARRTLVTKLPLVQDFGVSKHGQVTKQLAKLHGFFADSHSHIFAVQPEQ